MSTATPLGVLSWRAVSIGVDNLENAVEFWTTHMGFDQLDAREGPDAGLAHLWSIDAEQIAGQVLLGSGDASVGQLHLVEFTVSPDSVRAGAEAFDLCPKNLDIYAHDLPARVAELRAAGFQFRTDSHADVTAPNGTRFLEIHMPGHDDINIVLLEVPGKAMPFNHKNFYGVGPLIIIVPDVEAEQAFFATLGLQKLAENVLAGPEVEKLVGLPTGVALNISIWGSPDEPRAEMEIISYQGAAGKNLYARTRPPARGVLEVHYEIEDLGEYSRQLTAQDIESSAQPAVNTLVGGSRSRRLESPAGLRIVLWEAG